MIVRETVPHDVRCHPDEEGQQNGKRTAYWVQKEWVENIPISTGKHFQCGPTQNVKHRENEQSNGDAKQKSFDGVVSERAEIEPA